MSTLDFCDIHSSNQSLFLLLDFNSDLEFKNKYKIHFYYNILCLSVSQYTFENLDQQIQSWKNWDA